MEAQLVSKGSADTKRKTRKYKVRNGRSNKGKGKGHKPKGRVRKSQTGGLTRSRYVVARDHDIPQLRREHRASKIRKGEIGFFLGKVCACCETSASAVNAPVWGPNGE